MALTKCPSCQNKISSKASSCSHCGFSLVEDEEALDQLRKQKHRLFRNKMYRLKMLSYVAMAITLIGVVPMIWDYVKSIDYGFNASILNHWGVNWVVMGFILYFVIRILMLKTKRDYKTSK